MPKNLKKFRKKGETFDIEYKLKQKKNSGTKKSLQPVKKFKKKPIHHYLEEE